MTSSKFAPKDVVYYIEQNEILSGVISGIVVWTLKHSRKIKIGYILEETWTPSQPTPRIFSQKELFKSPEKLAEQLVLDFKKGQQ